MKNKRATRPSRTRTPGEGNGEEGKMSNGQRRLEKRSYQSLFTYESTEVLPTPVPRLAGVYGMGVCLAAREEECKGEAKGRMRKAMITNIAVLIPAIPRNAAPGIPVNPLGPPSLLK